MAFQVVISERPGNVHGRYHISVHFDVPLPSGEMVPCASGRVGLVSGHEELPVALAVARQVQAQGLAASIRTVGFTVPDALLDHSRGTIHIYLTGGRAVCGTMARATDMTEHRENATCAECLLVRQA